jgi:nicotinamide mononucleotide adenylyltransferase
MTVNYERQLVDYEETTIYLDYQTLGQIAEEIQRLIESYGADATVKNVCSDYGSDKEYPTVFTKRLENDKQYQRRIANEERWAKEREERDAAEYARLTAKFGKN